MIDRGKHTVLGVKIDALDYEAAVARIVQAAHRRQPLTVSALAVHGVMTGVGDPAHRYRLNAFDLICPDGQPVRWALNLLYGTALKDRVYGPTLMLETCRAAAREGLPIFLFGSSADTLARLEARLLQEFPSLQIAGKRSSRFRTLSDDEWQSLVQEIRDSGAAILFVGLGCPRQEVFAFEARDQVSIPTLAVGAAFSFHSGELAQAPSGLQRFGLEWLFRLAHEPWRLWRRYLLLNPAYLTLFVLQKLRIYHVPSDQLPAPPANVLYG
jgi:exopolysaccharide biosynthesis WecB/TagA/CpsF family protein